MQGLHTLADALSKLLILEQSTPTLSICFLGMGK